jgi:hypothetical protein
VQLGRSGECRRVINEESCECWVDVCRFWEVFGRMLPREGFVAVGQAGTAAYCTVIVT